MTRLRVLDPGGLALVMDGGRPGFAALGVPRGGAMDAFACAAANALLGNPRDAACVEMLAGGAEFLVEQGGRFAVCGADLAMTLAGHSLDTWRVTWARAGTRLRFGARRAGHGARAYLALPGGVAAPQWLGSRSVYQAGNMGAALALDDLVAGSEDLAEDIRWVGAAWPAASRPGYAAAPRLRVLPGPHAERLPGVLDWLTGDGLVVSAQANRQGLRLTAQHPHAHRLDLPSLGVVAGAVQLPPDGQPILLGADAQTTGGYPLIACVIGADLPLVGQLWAGDRLRFTRCSEADALAARREQAAWLAAGPDPDLWMAQAAGMG